MMASRTFSTTPWSEKRYSSRSGVSVGFMRHSCRTLSICFYALVSHCTATHVTQRRTLIVGSKGSSGALVASTTGLNCGAPAVAAGEGVHVSKNAAIACTDQNGQASNCPTSAVLARLGTRHTTPHEERVYKLLCQRYSSFRVAGEIRMDGGKMEMKGTLPPLYSPAPPHRVVCPEACIWLIKFSFLCSYYFHDGSV